MLLTPFSEAKVTKKMLQYYLDKGYNVELGQTITIKTLDLPPHSGVKVKYRCDNPDCLSEHELRFEDYLKKRKRVYAEFGDFCEKCSKLFRKKWYKENNPDGWKDLYKDIQVKMKQTNLEKYGVENPMQNQEIVQKLQKSVQEKYGTSNVMKVPEIRQRQTKSLSINNEIQEITTKEGKVYYMYKGMPCSKNQKYLGELFNGEINYFVDYSYSLDILLEDKIYFEYDGTGHALSVKMRKETQEEFDKKEIKRYYILKQKGYKQIKFISLTKSTLPSDEVLFQLLDIAKQYFSEDENNHWIEFNYDNGYIRTKQSQYDFDFD